MEGGREGREDGNQKDPLGSMFQEHFEFLLYLTNLASGEGV